MVHISSRVNIKTHIIIVWTPLSVARHWSASDGFTDSAMELYELG